MKVFPSFLLEVRKKRHQAKFLWSSSNPFSSSTPCKTFSHGCIVKLDGLSYVQNIHK